MPRAWWILLLGKMNTLQRRHMPLTDSSFATGWNYFFKYAIATPTNLTAAGLVVKYWAPDLNVAIWITVFASVVIAVNVRTHLKALSLQDVLTELTIFLVSACH